MNFLISEILATKKTVNATINIAANIVPVMYHLNTKATQLKTNNAQTGMIESVFLKNIIKTPLKRRATIKPKIISILNNFTPILIIV